MLRISLSVDFAEITNRNGESFPIDRIQSVGTTLTEILDNAQLIAYTDLGSKISISPWSHPESDEFESMLITEYIKKSEESF